MKLSYIVRSGVLAAALLVGSSACTSASTKRAGGSDTVEHDGEADACTDCGASLNSDCTLSEDLRCSEGCYAGAGYYMDTENQCRTNEIGAVACSSEAPETTGTAGFCVVHSGRVLAGHTQFGFSAADIGATRCDDATADAVLLYSKCSSR